jgi:hypothetical protein
MFITLTNASENHKNDTILINSDYIITIYTGQNAAKKVDGVIEKVTYIYCPPHGTWEVQESIEEVFAKLNQK